MFHFNPKSGATGKCEATVRSCPLGGAESHFTTEDAARRAFESTMDTAPPKLRKIAKPRIVKTEPPLTQSGFQEEVQKFFPEKSTVVAPPLVADFNGYMGGSRFIGGKRPQPGADGKTPFMSQKEAAAGIRKDVAAAKAAGEIPSWLNVSVTMNSGSMVSSIYLEVGMKRDGVTRAIPREWLVNENDEYSRRGSDAAERIEDYIGQLARQYEASETNSQVDYFNSSNAGRVGWRDAWRDRVSR